VDPLPEAASFQLSLTSLQPFGLTFPSTLPPVSAVTLNGSNMRAMQVAVRQMLLYKDFSLRQTSMSRNTYIKKVTNYIFIIQPRRWETDTS
jgi:hypothetical protein